MTNQSVSQRVSQQMNMNGDPKSKRDWGLIRKKGRSGEFEWYARIVRVDASGKSKQFVAKADNKTHARQMRDELDRKYTRSGARAIEGEKISFRKLAEAYRARKIIPPEYHESNGYVRKVAGLRSYKSVSHYLDVLIESFGSIRSRRSRILILKISNRRDCERHPNAVSEACQTLTVH